MLMDKRNRKNQTKKNTIMITKNRSYALLFLLVASLSLTSCEAIGDLIEFGMWIGIIIVLAIAALVFWLFRKIRRK